MSSSDHRSPIWVFDNPRTCSQLLHRFFKLHPDLETRAMHHWAASATTGGPERIQTRVKNRRKAIEADEKLQVELRALFSPGGTFDVSQETYAAASQRLTTSVEAAQAKGKIPYVKEHISCLLQPSILSQLIREDTVAESTTNPTVIPDELFKNIRNPLVQIRHPALVLPSWYRAQLINFANDPDEDVFRMLSAQRTTRWFFDFLRQQGREPILIDAEDVVLRSEALCHRLCEIWNISREGLTFNWDARAKSERMVHPMEHYVGRLEESTGVIRPEKTTVNIDVEYAKWIGEFGEDVACALKKRVDADMPDYLYLQQYRLTISE